jgi:Cu/Zn superoxide dismutase
MNMTAPTGEGGGHALDLILMEPQDARDAYKMSPRDLRLWLRDYLTLDAGEEMVGVAYSQPFAYDKPRVDAVVGELPEKCSEVVAAFPAGVDALGAPLPAGNITFTQGAHGAVTVAVHLANLEGAAAAPSGNKFHVHVNAADGEFGACVAAGGHYDPTAVEFDAACAAKRASIVDWNATRALANATGVYNASARVHWRPGLFPDRWSGPAGPEDKATRAGLSAVLSATAGDGCFYAGDLSGKLGALSPVVGELAPQTARDEKLFAAGPFRATDRSMGLRLQALLGKSVVIHAGDGRRWACATIRPGGATTPADWSTSAALARSDGSTLLTITGSSFGAEGLAITAPAEPLRRRRLALGDYNRTQDGARHAVMLGPYACAIRTLAHDKLTCLMAAGQGGAKLGLVVRAAGRQGGYADGTPLAQQLRYLRPKLWYATPDHGPTSGGTTITVMGDDLGLAGDIKVDSLRLANPCANGEDQSCIEAGSYSHTNFTFRLPPTDGSAVVVTLRAEVAGQTAAKELKFAYDEPRIDSLQDKSGNIIDTGPTSGRIHDEYGDITQEKFSLALNGENFGTTSNIEVRIGKVPLFKELPCGHPFKQCITAACGEPIVPPCIVQPNKEEDKCGDGVECADGRLAVEKYSKTCGKCTRHTKIVVYPGPGYGAGLGVEVRLRASRDAVNTDDNWVPSNVMPYGYNPPSVRAVKPDPCDAHGKVFTTNDAQFAEEAAAIEQNITDALAALCPAVQGKVTRDGIVRCVAQAQADSPAKTYRLGNLTEQLRTSPHRLHKCHRGACLGTKITFQGSNFGHTSSRAWVTLDGVNCTDTTWRNPRGKPYIECIAPPSRVGFKNVTLHVADQTITLRAAGEMLQTRCLKGYYGQFGEECLKCPPGAKCDGEYSELHRNYSEPTSIPGWWRMSPQIGKADARVGSDLAQCPPERHDRPGAYDTCHYFVPCEPKTSCTGENFCDVGYAGVRCSECAKGYFRRTGECEPCPDCPICMVLMFLGIGMMAGVVGYILSRKNIEMGIVAIGVDYFQILAMLARTKVGWPKAVLEVYYWLSAFNLNLELLAPECSFDVDYSTKWIVIELLPAGLIGIFTLVVIAKAYHKACIQKRTAKIFNHSHRLIGFSLMCFYFLYLYLTRTTLEIWNCQETEPSDGNEYMQAVFVKCHEAGGLQQKLLGPSVIFFLVYTVGYPAFVAFVLLTNSAKVQEDQLLRAKGTGQTRETNPTCHDFRKRYKDVYYRFKPEYYYWTLLIITRKFCIAAAALMFRKTPAFQLAVMQLVMFISYALQVRNNPYMSEAEKPLVVMRYQAQLDKKAFHALSSGIAGALKTSSDLKAKGKGANKLKLGDSATAQRKRQAAVAYFWNYNTVESVLLCCAVLVTLAGVMFQSGKLEDDKSRSDSLAYAVLVIIISSLVYFFTVLTTEIAIGLGWYRPGGKAPKPQGASASNDPAEERGLQVQLKKMERHKSRKMQKGSSKLGTSDMTPDDLFSRDSVDDGFEMPEIINPMLGGKSKAKEKREMAEGLVEAAETQAAMAGTIESLQAELRDAKKKEAQTAALGSSYGSSRALRAGMGQKQRSMRGKKKTRVTTFDTDADAGITNVDETGDTQFQVL